VIATLLFSSQFAYMQNINYYIRFENEAFTPKGYRLLKEKGEEYMKMETGNSRFDQVLSKYKIKHFSQAFPTAKSEWLQKVYLVESESALLYELEKQEFKKEISHIEPLCEPEPLYTPNDYSLAYLQTNLDLVKAQEGWDVFGNLPRIPIAVTETYVETTHEDLENQFMGFSGTPFSDSFHGTAVSGLLSATTNNGKGIASISLGAPLFVEYSRSDNKVLLLAQQGYRVINCSWYNSCSFSTIQNNLYQEIRDTWNAVVVFGAGNNVSHCDSLEAKIYPASYPSVLSVTSVGHVHDIGYMNPNLGPVDWKDCHETVVGSGSSHHHNDAVDICAPGYAVPTTMLDGQYGAAWGTSFAAPQVAATVCLILSINPCLSATQAMDMVKSTADNSIYDLPYNSPYIGLLGTGRLDVEAACLAAAESATTVFSTPTILSGTQEIEAKYAIRTMADIQIVSGADISFRARKEVELNVGFEIADGAIFEMSIDPNHLTNCN
jgi:subtilisin family serine protease